MTKKLKKILVATLIVILLLIAYKYSKPKYYLKNIEAKNLPCKIKPFRDSVYVYIPYEFTIYNNRLEPLKLSNIYDGYTYHNGYGKYLLYNLDNLELRSYWNLSKKIKTENLEKKYEDYTYFFTNHIFKYRTFIFPFLKRKFYYYKRFILSNKNDKFKIKDINKYNIRKQLYTFNYNLITNIDKSVTDSLYKLNNNKRFNVFFKSKPLIIKKIKAKINNETQKMEYVNLYDSIKIKNMNKAKSRAYLIDFMKRKPEDTF